LRTYNRGSSISVTKSKRSVVSRLTLKLQAGCLFIPMLRQLACSDCYILGFFTNLTWSNLTTLKTKQMEENEFNIKKQVHNCIDNELYLKKLKRNKRYKKVPTELTKYNNQVL